MDKEAIEAADDSALARWEAEGGFTAVAWFKAKDERSFPSKQGCLLNKLYR